MKKLPRNYHKPTGKIMRFFADLFLRYDQAYHAGYLDGAKKQRYFEGYADGQLEAHKFYQKSAIFSLKKKRKKVNKC